MQTTIQLDDVVFAEATKLAQRDGSDLSHLVEEALKDKIASCALAPVRSKISLTTVDGNGVLPGVNLDSSADLLRLMEESGK